MASVTASISRTIPISGYTYNLVFTATFKTSGTSSVTAKLTNSSAYSIYYNYDEKWGWSNGASGTYRLGTITGGETKTLFSTSTGFSSGAVSTTFIFYGIEYTISATLGSDATASTISFGSSTVTLGETKYVTINNGNNVTNKLYLSVGSKSIDTGLTSSGNYYFDADDLASLFTSSTTATFHLYSYSNGSQIGDSTASFTLKKAATISVYSTLAGRLNTVNTYAIAGVSKSYFELTLNVTYPDTGTKITSISTSAKYPDIDLTAPEFTVTQSSTSSRIVMTFTQKDAFPIPTDTSVSQYKFPELTVTVTDNAGTSITRTIAGNYIVYCYIVPEVTDVEISRCSSDGTISPSGTYAYAKLTVAESKSYTATEAKVSISGTEYSLTTEDNLVFTGVLGDGSFDTSTQYSATFSVRTAEMKSYNDTVWVTQTSILPTMQLPISLYDDTDQVGVSFGEMAQKYNDTQSESVVNFTKGLILRATNTEDGTVATKDAYDLIARGSGRKIFVQTDTTIPEDMADGDILIVYEEG
jgi:hypothetical protein